MKYMTLIHKIKGGAQLLNAKKFINSCEYLEKMASLPDQITSLVALLDEQNQIIARYQAVYSKQ